MSLAVDQLNYSDPSTALQLSQKAPVLLSSPAPASQFFPLSLLESPETPETWTDYERLFLACLQTGDDKSAHLTLARITHRFGAGDDRVVGLRGIFQEAVADTTHDLENILLEYEKILSDNPMNVPILKRRIAIKRSMQKPQEAISALVEFLESSPTDAEAWAELADLYHSQGMGSQAIFSLEEALLIAPNAWNLHARMGEVEYMTASTGSSGIDTSLKLMADSLQRFSRSIELCDDYLRGYYGLKITSSKLLQLMTSSKTTSLGFLSRETVQRLNDLATRKLRDVVESWTDQGASDLKRAEIFAAKEILNRSK